VKHIARLSFGAGALLGLAAWLVPVAAGAGPPQGGAPPFGQRADHAVFVQTNNPTGNQVVAYERAPDGTLTLARTYGTTGKGGVLQSDKAAGFADYLSSQGSLAYDPAAGDLIAVNAGSNTVSVFSVRGDRLSLQQVVSSGGMFPVSVAVHGSLVYVLNALDGGSLQGYVSFFGHLIPLPGSNRSLGLTIPPTTPPTQFTLTPGQVAFSPDGSQLVVTTKLNMTDIDVFSVGAFGYLSASPVVNSEPMTGPFSETFDHAGHLVVANVANDSLATYTLNVNGTVGLIDSVKTTGIATCWVTPAGRFFYTSNTMSNTLTGFAESFSGHLTFLGITSTDALSQDAAATPDGRFLYVQTGAKGIVDEFEVNAANGLLTEIGSVTVATAVGMEGIVAL
jgi:Lactonase, 7-bladed beta-propeller